jgi:hypothetical protein
MFGFPTTRIVAVIAALLIASVGAWGGWQYVQLQKAKVDVVTMKAERDEAAAALDRALEINRKNQTFIMSLQQEKADVQFALNALDARRKVDAATISKLSEIIRQQSSNPENQVSLSPVLQAIVDQIQKNRDARVGVKK